MKPALQILGIFGLLVLLAAANAGMNSWKKHDCIKSGGRFVLNTSDSSLSMCILEK